MDLWFWVFLGIGMVVFAYLYLTGNLYADQMPVLGAGGTFG